MRRVIALLLCLFGAVPAFSQQFYIQQSGVLKRGILNMNLFVINDYATINMFQEAVGFLSPSGGWGSATLPYNSAILDANGYPNCNVFVANACVSGKTGGTSLLIAMSLPASSNFAGPYCLQGKGTGVVSMLFGTGQSFTKQTGQTCAGFSQGTCDGVSHGGSGTVAYSGSTFTMTDESWAGWCIAVDFTGPIAQPLNGHLTSTDTNQSGHYMKALAFYEQPDGADFVAGKVFRAGFKSPIVSLDPSFIRFMNWGPGQNSSTETRFEYRATPANTPSYTGLLSLWTPFLPYAPSTGTNQLTIAGVTGTPVSSQHGEKIIFKAGSSSTGGANYPVISAITNANPGAVTTSGAHSFSTGDIVVQIVTGMTNLNYYPVCINKVDATHYMLAVAVFPATPGSCAGANIDTTSLGTFTGGNAAEFYTANVGNRGAYPVMANNGQFPYTEFETFTSGTPYQLCFNKLVSGQTDGSGNRLYGAWVDCSAASNWANAAPLEIETALVNELNAMSPAHTINMYVTTSQFGLMPTDPDYTTQSDYPKNFVNTILNGSGITNPITGASYPGLCSQCGLIVEDTDETWNIGGGDNQSTYFSRLGILYCANGGVDKNSYSTLHSELTMQDIKTIGSSRVKYVLGGQAADGFTSITSSINYPRVTGVGLKTGCTDYLFNPLPYPTGSVAPITYYDYFAVAPYFNPSATAVTDYLLAGNLCGAAAGGCVGQWVSDVTTFGLNSSQALADLATWVNLIQTDELTCSGVPCTGSINFYESQLTGQLGLVATGTTNNSGVAYNKTLINYEGGPNWAVKQSVVISATCTTNVVTMNFTNVGGPTYTNGEAIYVSGMVPSGYNGFQTIASLSGTTITYNVASCPGAATNLGFLTDERNAFLSAVRESQSWANAYSGFFSYFLANGNFAAPAYYVEIAQGFGSAYPDTYAAGVEGAGLYPDWAAMSTFNQAWP